jgi:branched-chain amino acid transport system substrate-binding protein
MKLKSMVALLVSACFAGGAHAQKLSNDTIKIGVMTDLSSIYSDVGGKGSVVAATLAVKDFTREQAALGKKVEVISADHQNKADIASSLAREWYDKQGVDVIVDLLPSSVALAVMEVAEQKGRMTLISGSSAQAITNDRCTAVNAHWNYEIYPRAVVLPAEIVKRGKKKWFFITGDYASAIAIEKEATESIRASGGEVVGSVKHPFSSNDFSSFVLTAQSSKADVIALSNAGKDTINAIKQAAEFGVLGSKQSVVPLVMFISDIHSLGLAKTQGMQFVSEFYWDRNDRTRAWARRFNEEMKRMPDIIHASVYSSVYNYLKAVAGAGTDDATAVMKQLKSMEVDDGLFKGKVRANGSFVHEKLLVEVKKPSESKGPWDYYKILKVIPPEEGAYPLKGSNCKLVKG